MFPEVMQAVDQRNTSEDPQTTGPPPALAQKLVGFGEHATLTFKEFYESADAEVKSYRTWLRAATSLEELRKYMLWRDKQEPEASTSVSASVSTSARAPSPFTSTEEIKGISVKASSAVRRSTAAGSFIHVIPQELLFNRDVISGSQRPTESLSEQECVSRDGTPGYQHVLNLAQCLVTLRLTGRVTEKYAQHILQLWERLPEQDKLAVMYSPQYRDPQTHGTFKNQGRGRLETSRLVEAICIQLCRIYTQNRSLAGARISRFIDILRSYNIIRDITLHNQSLSTTLQLFEMNKGMLTQWFNRRRAVQENEVLMVPPTSVQDNSTHTITSAAPPPVTPSAPPAATLMVQAQSFRLPKTTAWRRKHIQRLKEKAEREGRTFVTKAEFSCTCRLCKQPKTKEHGHSRFYSRKRRTMLQFCQATAGGQTVEEWLRGRRREEDELQ